MTEPDSDFREPHLRENDFLGAFAVIQSDAGILMVQNRRRIGGASVLTWDLPGGQVEPGEEELVEEIMRTREEEVKRKARDEGIGEWRAAEVMAEDKIMRGEP